MKLQSFPESSTPLSMAILNEAAGKTSLLNLVFCLAQYFICPGEVPGRKNKLSLFRLCPNVPNNVMKTSPFCSSASF